MTAAILRIELLSYWHAGSGLRRGGETDAIAMRDPRDGLPYLPGRTVKGLLREGVRLAQAWPESSGVPAEASAKIFGTENKTDLITTFVAHDARMPGDVGHWLRGPGSLMRTGLFENVASTKVDDCGIAADETLRVVEVCLPLFLEAHIEWDEVTIDERLNGARSREILMTAARLIRALGSHRHRGLGRCTAELIVP